MISSENFSKTFRQILFFIIPASVLIHGSAGANRPHRSGSGKIRLGRHDSHFSGAGNFRREPFRPKPRFRFWPGLSTPFTTPAFRFSRDLASEAVNLVLGNLSFPEIRSTRSRLGVFRFEHRQYVSFIFDSSAGDWEDSTEDGYFPQPRKSFFRLSSAGFSAQIVKYIVSRHVNIDTFLGIFIQLAASGAAGIRGIFHFLAVFPIRRIRNGQKIPFGKILRARRQPFPKTRRRRAEYEK